MTLAAHAHTPDLFQPEPEGTTPRQRHFAAASRWAKRIPLEKASEDKRRARELMMAHIKAGLAGEGIKR